MKPIKKLGIVLLLNLCMLIFIGCSEDAPEPEPTYTVTFNTNSPIQIADKTVTAGSTLTEPMLERDGYQLLGWYTDSSFTTRWNFLENTVVEPMTLWAKWQDILSIEDMLMRLKNSIYQEEMAVVDDAGLIDPSAVGVDYTQFHEEVRYPVPALETFVQVFYVADYGISPEADDNTHAFRAMLQDVQAVDGLKAIIFEAGNYKFTETIDFSNMDDLYLVGNETEWIMRTWQTIMRIESSNNFHINDIDFDYEISPTISGTISSVQPASRSVSIRVDDAFDLTNFRYNGGKINFGNYMEYVYDDFSEAYIPDPQGMLRYNSTGDNVRGISDGSYDHASRTLTLTFDLVQGAFRAPEIGKVVSVGFTMYEHTGILVRNSKNFFMETVNIYTTPGMSIRTETSENIYLNRTNIMLREGSKRLMTATADGFHAGDTMGEIIVSNSLYEASHDDAINIKTFYFRVDSVFRNNVTVNMTTTEIRIPIEVGDQLEFFEANTFTSKAIRTVVDVQSFGTTYEIILDENLPTGLVVGNDLVSNVSRIPQVTIENSIFRNKRNRGILVQFRDSVIRNNAFYNIAHGPLMVHAAMDVFAEAVVPQNIIIENNKFINNNQSRGLLGDVAVFRFGGQIVNNTITDITIENNYFYLSNYHAIYLRGTGQVDVRHNVFHDVATAISDDQASALSVNHVLDTNIIRNLYTIPNDNNQFTFLRSSHDVNTIKDKNIDYNLND